MYFKSKSLTISLGFLDLLLMPLNIPKYIKKNELDYDKYMMYLY